MEQQTELVSGTVNYCRYVWHKQALFKSRSPLYGTTWAGWEFWKNQVDDEWVKVYTQANALTDDELRAEPAFQRNPTKCFRQISSSLFRTTISRVEFQSCRF